MLAGTEVARGSPGPDYGIYAYTAREWDPEIGLYYYRARYYDPRVGRFISEDPVASIAGARTLVMMPFNLALRERAEIAWSAANKYAYVGGNPVRYIDALGLHRTSPSPPRRPPDAITCPGLCGWGRSEVSHTNTGVRDGEPREGCIWFIRYYDCNCKLLHSEVMIKCEQIDSRVTPRGRRRRGCYA